MGKIAFDSLQTSFVNEVKKNLYIMDHFYFTGGTALSVFYLGHRISEDLDFFSEENFSKDKILLFMKDAAEKCGFKYTLRQAGTHDVFIFSLKYKNGKDLKVDFNHYPYHRIEKSKKMDGLLVDSIRDIAANKLLTINQRTTVKDFVDLYFLLKKFTIWDLIYGVEAKFHMELDQLMIAEDFLKTDEFEFLPKMLVPLKLTELKSFFRSQALEIGKRITKK